MRVFIANFGRENYLWPACHARSTVATLEAEDLRPIWLAGDREAYIERCIATKKTASGLVPTRPVASRWFNLASIISSTENDCWIHREKEALWWTISRPGEVQVSLEPAVHATRKNEQVYVLHKPADAWSNKDKKGRQLSWRALHRQAQHFLFTEGTLQQVNEENAAYALALINGESLEPWHSLPVWKLKAETAKKGAVTVFDARQRAAMDMALQARDTAATSKGQQVLRTVKNKEFRFKNEQEAEKYIAALVADQEEICALTGLRLQFKGEHDDEELLCSLDRIDSSGHYEAGNLQVVCRFANRWKSDGDNAEFQRLIRLIRSTGNH